jgi:outer membrane protein assembly factor BamB
VSIKKISRRRFLSMPLAAAPLYLASKFSSVQRAPTSAPSAPAGDHYLFLPLVESGIPTVALPSGADWSTVAANPARTSWVSGQVSGDMRVEWFRPIEAYIPQNVQIIASQGLLFVATARGLYALDAATGEIAWRFDTELPLGNSPTVADGVVYFGGLDRKLHALRAADGTPVWSYDGAHAGYSTNPLVVDGKVILGNRDGNLYAIGAAGSSAPGALAWKYQTGGPILVSAAYAAGVVYFASMDNHAYALAASNGALQWKSGLLPGDGYQSYWPVVYQDKVIFAGATSYRDNNDPGTRSVQNSQSQGYNAYDAIQRDSVFFDKSALGTPIGPNVPGGEAWAHGRPVMDGARISEYLEQNSDSDPNLHKPWRRTCMVLNTADGSEYTADVDSDGHPEFAPFLWWGTHSGNAYPPIAGPDGVLYHNNVWTSGYIPQGLVMGWKPGSAHLSLVGGQGADDEPQALSGGGNMIYRSIVCDRVGDWFSILDDAHGQAWGYAPNDLATQIPGYDVMWWGITPGLPRLVGNYGTRNGIYHNHGVQNPIVPYNGRLYIHRSNAVVAYGTRTGHAPSAKPLLTVNRVTDTVPPLELSELKARLEAEIAKMIAAGKLRPGYMNNGAMAFGDGGHLPDYFVNPGETLLALSRAYPYLSSTVQQQTRTYLQTEFSTYFDPTLYARRGWSEGAAREWMPTAPEIAASMAKGNKSPWAGDNWSWYYPPHNFYAMWKYALIATGDVQKIYNLAKNAVQVPCPADDDYLRLWPYEHNAYIAGYTGFIKLQDLAGQAGNDASLRNRVNGELQRLLQLRASAFSKDSPWVDPGNPNVPIEGGQYHYRMLNVARNFIYLVPELADYLRQNALSKVQAALDEYTRVAPYWFVSRFDSAVNEGAIQPLYDVWALFQARALLLKEPREQLTKYLDAPAFARGDLIYINNLVTAIEAPSSLTTSRPARRR